MRRSLHLTASALLALVALPCLGSGRVQAGYVLVGEVTLRHPVSLSTLSPQPSSAAALFNASLWEAGPEADSSLSDDSFPARSGPSGLPRVLGGQGQPLGGTPPDSSGPSFSPQAALAPFAMAPPLGASEPFLDSATDRPPARLAHNLLRPPRA